MGRLKSSWGPRAAMLGLGPLLLLFPILGGCRLPAKPMATEIREVRQSVQKSVRARLSTDGLTLGLHFLMKGRDAYATARLDSPKALALTFQPNAAARDKVLGKGAVNVPVFGPDQWRSLAHALAWRVAPASPRQGRLILAGGRELIAHRVNGQGNLTPLSGRPPHLKITGKTNTRELEREVFATRGDALDRPLGLDGPMVLLTGTFPEVVFLDPRSRRMVFLSVPPEEAAGLPLTSFSTGRNLVRQVAGFFWRSTVLAVVRNPFSTTSRMVASATSIAEAGVGRVLSRLPEGPPPPLAQGAEMEPVAWREALSKIAGTPVSAAALRIRLGGDEFFPDFIQAVQNARLGVDVQIYIFDNDDYATGVADLLRQRSSEGVRVRVLLDDAASLAAAASPPESPMPADFTPPDAIISYLKRGPSQVQVRRMPMSGLSASHTKIITIDNEIAWLGGMNIGREYRYDWHDLMIEARGPLVDRIRKDFAGTWARYGWGGDFAVARQKWKAPAQGREAAATPPGAIAVQPLYTGAGRSEIAKAQLEALRRCRRRAWLENAYLSDDAFVTELVKARYRGVDVRVVLPADNDNALMAANNRALAPLLLRHGIRVYLLPGMSHVKAALYDGWACVGSANFDRLSLRVNNEFSIGIEDGAFVGELGKRLFETDFRRSREVTALPKAGSSGEFFNALIRSVAGQF